MCNVLFFKLGSSKLLSVNSLRAGSRMLIGSGKNLILSSFFTSISSSLLLTIYRVFNYGFCTNKDVSFWLVLSCEGEFPNIFMGLVN